MGEDKDRFDIPIRISPEPPKDIVYVGAAELQPENGLESENINKLQAELADFENGMAGKFGEKWLDNVQAKAELGKAYAERIGYSVLNEKELGLLPFITEFMLSLWQNTNPQNTPSLEKLINGQFPLDTSHERAKQILLGVKTALELKLKESVQAPVSQTP